jgi:putative hemolysin
VENLGLISLVAALLLLGLNLYVSTLAYALRAYSRARLAERLSEADNRLWLDWLDEQESAVQMATSFARLGLNFAILLFAVDWYFEGSTATISTLTLLPLVLSLLAALAITNIGIAHALAFYAGEAILARSLNVVRGVLLALWPVTRMLAGIEFVVRRLLGKSESTAAEESERAEEEILDAVSEGKAIGAVDEEQEDMIEAIFSLHDTAVSAIMTPRTDIIALDVSATYDDVRKLVLEAGHSRIPVFEETLDAIVGVLYVKDLVRLSDSSEFEMRSMLRSVPYVPETKTIDALLRDFRQRRIHMAIVLDEYGGTAGLVTIEDILEEVVGEIDDEYDASTPPPISKIDDDTLEVDGRVHVSEVNEELDLENGNGLPEDGDYETIGGFVFTHLGKIPDAGEKVQHENISVTVLSAEPRRINRLRIHVAREQQRQAG